MDTTNEPVAWMYERPNGSAKLSFVQEKMLWDDMKETPLYTHPVKELTAQEVMEQTHRKISEAHWKAKELTDEEIEELIWNTTDMKDFARAILRKAQEK